MGKNITKARIADAAIAYIEAVNDHAMVSADDTTVGTAECDAAMMTMHDREEDLAELVFEYKRLQEVIGQ